METLGSLVDKLTIIKLKQFHTPFDNTKRFESLDAQEKGLIEEIDEYVAYQSGAVIPANKVCELKVKVFGTLGGLISNLALTNCKVWHLQEKIYDFANVPEADREGVIRDIAKLNITRTTLIEEIDKEYVMSRGELCTPR
jgi:hypothetical protein